MTRQTRLVLYSITCSRRSVPCQCQVTMVFCTNVVMQYDTYRGRCWYHHAPSSNISSSLFLCCTPTSSHQLVIKRCVKCFNAEQESVYRSLSLMSLLNFTCLVNYVDSRKTNQVLTLRSTQHLYRVTIKS